ncbi:MAG: hypothetical protein VXZ82_10100 [Planctomycetota bacterium]|nr:hypothetical protein [Planctomycetota bacterium]
MEQATHRVMGLLLTKKSWHAFQLKSISPIRYFDLNSIRSLNAADFNDATARRMLRNTLQHVMRRLGNPRRAVTGSNRLNVALNSKLASRQSWLE